ncbi:MAG TPA: glycosyltransferase [Bryobacteraceae bacterium]|nr:glycosyltransferase [Bryobacteraceae bacterium]
MKLVIFGLSVSSSWGNGHATLWRGLIRALGRRGHQTVFYERDVAYYASHRDLTELPGLRLELYEDWPGVREAARRELADADVAMVTSFCPDGADACELVQQSRAGISVFYDLDTPVTLDKLRDGERVPYIGRAGLEPFDLVLSYTGGPALENLKTRLGARQVAPLYGHVDPSLHRPVEPQPHYRADLSYLGTYAADRQKALEALLVDPARRMPGHRFVIGGAMYPPGFPWTANIHFVRHLPPGEHPAFFASSRITLNVTRRAMAAMGWCPSGRLFEAAACGTPVLSDRWDGLEHFYEPGREILLASTTEEAIAAISMLDGELRQIGDAARERTLTEHTAEHRAAELERLLESADGPALQTAAAQPTGDGYGPAAPQPRAVT